MYSKFDRGFLLRLFAGSLAGSLPAYPFEKGPR